MATGNDLVGYTGNAALGSGTNAEVPAIDPNANLNPILDAGKNIMLLDADRNDKIFKQKIADRDKRLQLFDSGQIAAGNILDKDRPVYEKAKKDANDAFGAMIDAGGLDNPKAYEAYQEKVTDLQNTVTHAQERWAQMGLLKQEQSQQTVPSRIKDYQNHIDGEEKKDFNSFIDPYQHLLDYNQDVWRTPALNGALSGGAITPTATTDKTTTTTKGGKTSTTQTETTGAVKGKQPQIANDIVYKNGLPYSRTKQEYSFGKIKGNTTQGYFNPEIGAQQDLLLKNISDPTKTAPYAQKDYLNHLIQRADDYNRDRGLRKGDEDYADVDKYKKALGYDDASGSVMPNPVTGKYDIGLSAPEFAALSALASVDGSYAPTSDVLMKDAAELSEKTLHDRAMEGIGWEKANAYKRLTDFKLSKAKTEAEQNQVFNSQYLRNYAEQQNLITTNQDIPKGGNVSQFTFNNIPADKSLPIYTIEGKVPAQLKPFDAETVHSLTPIRNDNNEIIGYPKGDKITYRGGYFKPVYMRNGKQIDSDCLASAYNIYIKTNPDYKGDVQDFLKKSISEDKSISVQTRGENGATDNETNIAAQRIINNLDTKKDQENPFGDGEQPPPDNTETTTETSSYGGSNVTN